MANNTDELSTKIAELEAENEALRTAIAELQAQPAKAAVKPSAELPAFTLNKVNFKFKIPGFNLDGVVHSAADAVKDPALLADIVANYPGLIETV